MPLTDARQRRPVALAVIGAGRIGTNHAAIVAHQVRGATARRGQRPGRDRRAAPRRPRSARRRRSTSTTCSPVRDVDGVLITAPARSHTDLVVAAAVAGKHVFVREADGRDPRRRRPRHRRRRRRRASCCRSGSTAASPPRSPPPAPPSTRQKIGTPQLLRSLTRDPGPFTADPARIPQWTIFLETLIHDFDTLCFLNPGATPGRGARVRRRARRPGRQDERAPRHRRRHDPVRQRRHRDRRRQLQRPVRLRRARRGLRIRRHGHRRYCAQQPT